MYQGCWKCCLLRSTSEGLKIHLVTKSMLLSSLFIESAETDHRPASPSGTSFTSPWNQGISIQYMKKKKNPKNRKETNLNQSLCFCLSLSTHTHTNEVIRISTVFMVSCKNMNEVNFLSLFFLSVISRVSTMRIITIVIRKKVNKAESSGRKIKPP